MTRTFLLAMQIYVYERCGFHAEALAALLA